MRARQTFAQALEEALDTAQDGTAPAADRFVYLPASAAPFVFVYSRLGGASTPAPAARQEAAAAMRARTAYRASASPASPATSASSATSTSSPFVGSASGSAAAVADAPRPTATLTALETRAIDAMVALGAEFRHGFTARDLRREFRRLAREYHPDRHQDHSLVEQERLAKVFAELTEHYRCLAAVFERDR